MKLDRILLTTDLSEEAERPYESIRELARSTGAEVQLLHVVEDVPIAPHGAPLAPPLHAPDVDARARAAKETLADHAAKLGDDVKVAHQVIKAPSVGEAIADHASENGFDLVAISSHGRSGFRRMIMGSVAEKVLRHCKVPVLVFPRTD